MISVTFPMRTVSEANSHEHWRARQKRAKAQRYEAAVRMMRERVQPHSRLTRELVGKGAVSITLTRIAPRKLDSDNLAGSFKAIRDGIADVFGIDDGDERLDWRYAQQKGKPGEYAVRVNIEPKGDS